MLRYWQATSHRSVKLSKKRADGSQITVNVGLRRVDTLSGLAEYRRWRVVQDRTGQAGVELLSAPG